MLQFDQLLVDFLLCVHPAQVEDEDEAHSDSDARGHQRPRLFFEPVGGAGLARYLSERKLAAGPQIAWHELESGEIKLGRALLLAFALAEQLFVKKVGVEVLHVRQLVGVHCICVVITLGEHFNKTRIVVGRGVRDDARAEHLGDLSEPLARET